MSNNIHRKRVKFVTATEPYDYYLAADVSAAYLEVLDNDPRVSEQEAVGEIYNLIHECLLQAAE